MYSIKIRDHIMVAHSLDHPGFGMASQLHGATYIVDASFYSPVLNEMNVVLDIAWAAELLKKVLAEINYKNLDGMEKFQGKLTTTEYLCRYIHDELSREISGFFAGDLSIELGESHVAWAAYQAKVTPV